MVFGIGTAISILGYGQLVHVKCKAALHIILVIQVEPISLKRHMLKRALVASIGILRGCPRMEVQLLDCFIIDILRTDGRAMSCVMVFSKEIVVRRYGLLVATYQGLARPWRLSGACNAQAS